MKILRSLPKKINNPNLIGFASASLIYLAIGIPLFQSFNTRLIKPKQEGNHTISLRISSIDNGGDRLVFNKEQPTPPLQSTPKPNRQKPHRKTRKIEKKHEQQPQKIHKKEIAQQEIPKSNTNQKAEHQAQTLAHNDGVSDELFSKIRTAISSYNQYPRVARMKKIEGEVIVEFILSQNGIMEELKIIESSAEEILKKSALKAVKKASKHFPSPPQKIKIRVPIVYSLKA